MIIDIPDDLIADIDAYLDADWSIKRDPSKFGALNAVAHIGERMVAIRSAMRESALENVRRREGDK